MEFRHEAEKFHPRTTSSPPILSQVAQVTHFFSGDLSAFSDLSLSRVSCSLICSSLRRKAAFTRSCSACKTTRKKISKSRNHCAKESLHWGNFLVDFNYKCIPKDFHCKCYTKELQLQVYTKGLPLQVLHQRTSTASVTPKDFNCKCYTKGLQPQVLHPRTSNASVHPRTSNASVHPRTSTCKCTKDFTCKCTKDFTCKCTPKDFNCKCYNKGLQLQVYTKGCQLQVYTKGLHLQVHTQGLQLQVLHQRTSTASVTP